MREAAIVLALALPAYGAFATGRQARRLYGSRIAVAAVVVPWLIEVGLVAVTLATYSVVGLVAVVVFGVLITALERRLFYLGGGPRQPRFLTECIAILNALSTQRRITRQDRHRIEALMGQLHAWRSDETDELIALTYRLMRFYIGWETMSEDEAEATRSRIFHLLPAQLQRDRLTMESRAR